MASEIGPAAAPKATNAEEEKVTALYYKENAYAGEQFQRGEVEAAKVKILAAALLRLVNEINAHDRPSFEALDNAGAALERAGIFEHVPLNCGCPDATHCPDAIQKCEDETGHAEVPGTGYCRCTHVMYEGESHEDI